MDAVKEAKAWQVPPLVFLGVHDPTEGWSGRDTLLALAVSIYERVYVCDCCKYPKRLAHDPDNDGWFEVDESTVCYAGAAREEWEAAQQKQSAGVKGVVPSIVYARNA